MGRLGMVGRCSDHVGLAHILLENNHRGREKSRSSHPTITIPTTSCLDLSLNTLELLC